MACQATTQRRRTIAAIGASVLLLACAGDERGDSVDENPDLNNVANNPIAPNDNDNFFENDVPTNINVEVVPDEGCAKVDFLFAIDNSGSMNAHQVKLQESFPGFIETIRTEVDAQDYHIMVVDSDADEHQVQCEERCPNDDCKGYTCGIVDSLTECETAFGSGQTGAHGGNAANRDCEFDTADRFINNSQSNLDDTFVCAASVGDFGSSGELTFSAFETALSPELNGTGGCNEGFRRDDAILVLTVITDDVPEYGEGDNTVAHGTIEEWRQALLDSAHGNESSVVVLGLVATGEDSSCIPQYTTSPGTPKFVDFVESWGEQGIVANICQDNFQEFFKQAVAKISSTCDDFQVPVL